MNLPNKITVTRFFISIGYFIMLAFFKDELPAQRILIDLGLIIFIVAALTDSLDGYLARRYGMTTKFGRMVDPLVDKIMVCGSFVFLASWSSLQPFIPAWVVVVIISREFLVQGIRSLAEAKGISFPSTHWGKQKMWLQSITVAWSFFYLGHLSDRPVLWAAVILHSLVWITLVSTVISGAIYLFSRKAISEITQDV